MEFNKSCKQVHITGTAKSPADLEKKKKSRNSGKRSEPTQTTAGNSSRARSTSESSNRSVHFSKSKGQKEEEDFQKRLLQMKADVTKDLVASKTAAVTSWLQTQLGPLHGLLAPQAPVQQHGQTNQQVPPLSQYLAQPTAFPCAARS